MAQKAKDVDTLRMHYKLETRLGKGETMTGNVFKCIQKSIGTPRAVKILKPALVRDALSARKFARTFIDEFLSETKYLAELFHPNIVGIIDGGKVAEYDLKTK